MTLQHPHWVERVFVPLPRSPAHCNAVAPSSGLVCAPHLRARIARLGTQPRPARTLPPTDIWTPRAGIHGGDRVQCVVIRVLSDPVPQARSRANAVIDYAYYRNEPSPAAPVTLEGDDFRIHPLGAGRTHGADAVGNTTVALVLYRGV